MNSTVTDTDTDPQTPSTVALEELFSPRTTARHRGDFAQLIPTSEAAQYAFDNVAQRIKLDPDFNLHARQFIHIYDVQRQVTPDAEGSHSSTAHGEDDEDNEDAGEATQAKVIWTGYYRLNLDIHPDNRQLGWILGRGRKDLPNGGVDFLLVQGRTETHIRGRHARLAFNLDNGRLMLVVDKAKTVYVNGGEKVSGSQRLIVDMNTSFSIDNLTYKLRYTGMSEIKFREQLQPLLSTLRPGLQLPSTLEVTPSELQYRYGGFIIQPPFDAGSFGTISAGVNEFTGEVVVIKRVKRTTASLQRIQLEVDIYGKIGNHPNLCQLVTAIYSGGDNLSMGTSTINDVYLIQKPLAHESFLGLIPSATSDSVRIEAFRQVVNGLAHLHGNGIMHRDIKPANLMMVSYIPVHAIIIDFGSATLDKTSKDHSCGTIAYLAPEVLALKKSESEDGEKTKHDGTAYNSLVDIWSLGLTGYQLFFRAPCEWSEGVDCEKYKGIVRDLDSRAGHLSQLLRPMLAWQSENRPSCERILAHPLWAWAKRVDSDDLEPKVRGMRKT